MAIQGKPVTATVRNAEPTYEVRVTLTVAIPGYGTVGRPSLGDEIEHVMAALRQEGPLPTGSHFHGSIEAKVRTMKEIATDKKRAEQRRLRG